MTTETDNDNVFIPSIGILSSDLTDTNVNLSLPNIINQINNIETIFY